MTDHEHHPDCKHFHKHKAGCDHGKPTAVPRSGVCSVCDLFTYTWRYCSVHFQWECPQHPDIGLQHGGGAKK